MKKKPVFCWADPDNEFMAWELQPNEIISDDDAYYKLDFENFDFKQLDECGQSLFQRDKIKQFLDSYHIKMNVEDYITLRNFQHYMHTVWHNYDANVPYRKEIFKLKHRGKDNPMLLSDAFKWKFAGSMESSLLAQMYFQHCGIESKVCFGHVFLEQYPEEKGGEIQKSGNRHVYLIVSFGYQNDYIYDPINPLFLDYKPVIPRIMSYKDIPFGDRKKFENMINKPVAESGGFAYREALDIYGVDRCWLYGFEADDIENKVIRYRTTKGIQRRVLDQPQMLYEYPTQGR